METCPDLLHTWGYPVLPQQPMQAPAVFHSVAEICKRFNEERCLFKQCRYRHACSNCRKLGHPVMRCPDGKTPSRVHSPRKEGRQ